MKINSLRQFERVKSPQLIEKIFSRESMSVSDRHILIKFIFTNTTDYPLKAGFSVSKRLYRRAHDRNKLKRWLRESYRSQKSGLLENIDSKKINCAMFIILTKPVESISFKEFSASISNLLDKINTKISKLEPKDI